MATTIRVVNPSSNDFTLVVGRVPFHIPAGRWENNPVEIKIREDLVPAFLRSIKKRPVLRVLPQPEPETPAETKGEDVAPQISKADFMSACKAAKTDDGSWELTLPDGEKMTVEADHHLRAKEIAYEMLYGTTFTETDKE